MFYKTCFSFMVLILSLLSTPPLQASGIPVLDVANLTQAIQNAINQGLQISNQATQISNQIQSIQNQVRSLQMLSSGNFNTLNGNFTQQLSQIQSVLSATQSIGYNLQSVQSQFDILFPTETDWNNMNTAQYQNFYQQWHNSLRESSQTAMQAQASMSQIQQRNLAAQNILSSIQGADGEVRQLQANNQLLAVVSQQMSDMNQTLATSSRVTATMAAKAAGEEQAKRAATTRARRNYTDMGAPPSVLNQLPGR